MLERCYPPRALKACILLKRIPLNHTKHSLIEELFHREDSGHWGEKNLDYCLSFLPDDQYYIFQHIRLKYKQWTFQIDFLLLTTKFALIIEAKNLGGLIYFDNQFNQVIQTQNGKEKCYEAPIEQVKRQQMLLSKWLKKHTSLSIPIHHLVVMSNSNAILKTDPNHKEVLKKVCKPFKLLDKISEIEKIHNKEIIIEKDLRKACKLLIKHHVPEEFDILGHFNISLEEIPPGARCENCNKLPMVYKNGKWYCPFCQTYSKTAHIESLNDYFYLIKNTITNFEFRSFLHVPTMHIAQKLLKNSGLPSTGTGKARIYYQKDVTQNALHRPPGQTDCHKVQSR